MQPNVPPIVNCEEIIGKTVGRRVPSSKPGHYGFGMQKVVNQLTRPHYPRGVFRFHSHEEADQWLLDHLIRKPVN